MGLLVIVALLTRHEPGEGSACQSPPALEEQHARLLELGRLTMSARPAEHVSHEELECEPDLPAEIGNVDRVPYGRKVRPCSCLSLVRVDLGVGAVKKSVAVLTTCKWTHYSFQLYAQPM